MFFRKFQRYFGGCVSEKMDFREGAFGFYYQPNYGKWLVIKLVINECLQEGAFTFMCRADHVVIVFQVIPP